MRLPGVALGRDRWLRIAAWLAAGLAVSTFVAYGLHLRLIRGDFRFVPKESAFIIRSGPIAGLWSAVDGQFGRAIADDGGETAERTPYLRTLIQDARQYFTERGVSLESLDDFRKAGIDVERGVIYASYSDNPSMEQPFVLVLHVVDREALKRTITAFSGAELLVEFPRADVALVSNSRAALARSRDERANLRAMRQNDALYEGLQHRPGGADAELFVFLRSHRIAAIRQVSIAANLGDDGLQVHALVDVAGGTLRAVDNLVSPPPRAARWAEAVPRDVAGAMAWNDAALPAMIESLGAAGLREPLSEAYGGLIWALRRVDGLRRLVVGATSYRNGVPDLLIGVWGPNERIVRLLRDLRIEFRERRDRSILSTASERARAQAPDAELLPEPHSTFDRYTVNAEGAVEGRLTPADVANETYAGRTDGIEFIAPRPTLNDRRFREEFSKLPEDYFSGADADRYRMAFLSRGEAVWLATDAAQLQSLRTGSGGGLDRSAYYAAAAGGSGGRGKIEVVLNVDQMSRLGMLSPEAAVDDFVARYLMNFTDHPAVALRVSPCTLRRHCLDVTLRAVRREALQ